MDNLPHPEEPLAPEDDWDLAIDEAFPPNAADTKRPELDVAEPAASALTSQASAAEANSQPVVLRNRMKLDHFPAFAARSALFGVGKRLGETRHNGPIKAQGDYALRLNGERLYMRDKQVWEAAMQIAKGLSGIGQEISVSLSDIAKRIGSTDTSGSALAWIWGSMERLAKAHVEVRLLDGQIVAGRLLASARRHGKEHYIRFDPALAAPIFAMDRQFKIQSNRRRMLATSLAQWLHDFVSTHAAYPRNLTLGYVRELCGYDGQVRRFPELLIAALAELSAVVPELVVGHEIVKTGRSSDTWEIKITRGVEVPAFVMPKFGAVNGPARDASTGNGNQKKKWLSL